MMRHPLIGLCGRRGCGKNEAALALREFRPLAVADPIRRIVSIAFGVTEEEMQDRVLKERQLTRWPYKSPRELLQHVGTDLLRASYPGIWEERLRETIMREQTPTVVTDVRLKAEGDVIHSLKGIVIRIIRPAEDGEGGHTPEAADAHTTETGIDAVEADYIVINNGTREDLHREVRFMASVAYPDIAV